MGRLLDALIGWSIHHRAVVLLAAAALFAGGIYEASGASLDVLPDFIPPRVVVQTEAPGLGTPDVESLVTRPVERALLGTPGAARVQSVSTPGLSVVSLTFHDSVGLYRARQSVSERLSLVRLPQSVRPPRMTPISAPIGALTKVCLTAGKAPGRAMLRRLRTFAEWTLEQRLLAVPGVARVTVHGGEEARIEVRPNAARLSAHGISLDQLVRAVKGSQAMLGAGFVDDGTSRLEVRTDVRLRYRSVEHAISRTVVGVKDGAPVRVGDVASVVLGDAPRIGIAFYDGRPAVYLQIDKLPWADAITVNHAIDRVLDAARGDLPKGARLEPPVFTQASFIEAAVGSVGRAMLFGALLVVLVLLAFLRSGRLAAVSLTAIPTSIVAALGVLVLLGATVNGMILGGLAVAVGEVVDDAIVDVENVWRRLGENLKLAAPRPVLEVIRDASHEIRGSVVYATIIVCLVLVPVLFLGGIAGRIFSPLAQAYVLAITASLLVALTVTPAMCAWLLPRLLERDATATRTRLAEALLSRYRGILARVVRRPRLVVAGAGALALVAMAVVPFLGGRFLPAFHEGNLIAELHAAPMISLDASARLAERVATKLRPGLAVHVAGRTGRAELDEDAAPVSRTEMDVVLAPGAGGGGDPAGAVAQAIAKVPGVTFAVEGMLSERIHEILAGETAPVVVEVLGPSLPVLRRLAAQVAGQMEKVQGLATVRVEPQIAVPQIRIDPDPARLARYGVRPAELARDVATLRQGTTATQILEPTGRVVDVVVVGAPEERSRAAIADLPIDTPLGGTVPLSALARVDTAPVPAEVRHEGGQRRIVIGADAPGASLSTAVAHLKDRLDANVHPPAGYHVEVGGESVARARAARRLVAIGAGVLLGIFVLLATAFASTRDAGIVLLNFPMGLVGGVAAALLAPGGLSVAGFVGFVTLFGIIARNGILLVAHKQHLDRTLPDLDAVARILKAAEERLLPIVMTAATAFLGLLPLAISIGKPGSELEAPMALIVCGGLLTSTALNLVVLPAIYVWMARRKEAPA